AIVDGGVRDVAHSRAIQFPLWSADITPITGKWRSEVAEVNGPVTVCARRVSAGDLVVADETGGVFVPRARVLEVGERVEVIARQEAGLVSALATDTPLAVLMRRHGHR